VGFPTVYNGF